ncbi:MAG TPA: glycosyltransferase family 2 protein [Acidobacteriaceae bacterium]|nr:glycosyltransferase family 2 protein [Acidobacteriaceae bacterium]
MKISFVVPAYNEEAYLPRTLTAILAQTANARCETEVIVVNNASTDQTREVALGFPGVKVVDEPQKGLTHARQAGLNASTGDIIANVDADSILTDGWIEKVQREFERNPRLVGLSGPFIYYDLTPRQRGLVRLYYVAAYMAYLINRYVLRVGSMLQGGNFVVRRTALEKIGGFNLAISFYGEDTDLARRLVAAGDVKFTFALPMYSSARRLAKEGIATMALRYSANYVSTTFLKRPINTKHIDIRS